MSRTLAGNLTGKAAQLEIADLRLSLYEKDEKRRSAKTQEWYCWLEALKILDPSWETWFDSRPETTVGEMREPIQNRVKELIEKSVMSKREGNAYAAMDIILGTEPATQREMESMIELFE